MKTYTIYQIKSRAVKDAFGSLVVKRLRSGTKADLETRVGLNFFADVEAKTKKEALKAGRRLALGIKI